MVFRSAGPTDLSCLISWIADANDCLIWAGPAVTFPVFLQALMVQIEYTPENSFCLVDGERMVAFGQLIKRTEYHFHLARLIVAPEIRGNGYGRKLCRYLIERAVQLNCQLLTLNVYQDNLTALGLYRKIGFEVTPAADGMPLPSEVVHMKYQWPEQE